MFYVGQKVVCINDKPYYPEGHIMQRALDGKMTSVVGGIELKKGDIYTIRELLPTFLEGTPGVRVAEVIRDLDDDPYRIERFRPLDERKTDISIFTALLTPVKGKKKEKVDG